MCLNTGYFLKFKTPRTHICSSVRGADHKKSLTYPQITLRSSCPVPLSGVTTCGLMLINSIKLIMKIIAKTTEIAKEIIENTSEVLASSFPLALTSFDAFNNAIIDMIVVAT